MPGEEELLNVGVSWVGESHEVLEFKQAAILFVDGVLVVDGPQELSPSQPLLPTGSLRASRGEDLPEVSLRGHLDCIRELRVDRWEGGLVSEVPVGE